MSGRAIVFDLFDTLVVSGWRPRGAHLGELLGMPQEFNEVWRDCGYRRMTTRVPFSDLLEEVYRQAGREPDADAIAELAGARSRYKAKLLQTLEPDVLAMLKSCRAREVRIAVASGCACEDVESWDQSALAPLVDVTVFSCDVGSLKPDRRVYDIALGRLNVPGQEAIFVGDGAGNELQGALDAELSAAFWATWFLDKRGSQSGSLGDTPLEGFRRVTQPAQVLELLDATR